MNRSRWGRTIALGLGVLLVAVGCGGGDGDDEPETEASAGGPTVADGATPRRGGTLTFGLEGETTGGFCLAEAQLAASGIMVHNAVYDPLLALDADFEVQPWLAESVTPNADHTAFAIKLRPGITFSDGSVLDARIVKLNLDTDRGEPAAVALTGRNPLLSRVVLENIASIDVVDDLTVSVNMKRPWVAFPDYLASGRFGIMGEAQIMAPDCSDRMVGTGPFVLASWERNQEMVLDRNPNYWQTDANGEQLPYLDHLVFKPIPSRNDRYDALEAGTIMSGHFSDPVSIDELDASSFTLVTEPEGHQEVGHFLLNVKTAPLDDVAVREHLAMAIDREALRDVAGGTTRLELADQPYDSKVMGYQDDIEPPVYDPEAAAAFFEGKDIRLRYVTGTDPSATALSEEMRRQLDAVGVGLDIELRDQSTIINQMLSGDFDVVLSRNYPGEDPDTNFVWWHSNQPTNFGGIADPEIDRALDDGRSNPDEAARRADYEEIGDVFAAEHQFLWNWYDAWGMGATDEVHQLGWYQLPDGSDGAGMNWGWSYWTHVWVDQ